MESLKAHHECPLMGVTVGTKLEVLYTVHLEGVTSPQKVWFVATLKSLRYMEDNRGSTLNGVIHWLPSEHFPSSTSRVVFVDRSKLRDEQGGLMGWRLHEDHAYESDEDLPVVTERGDEDADGDHDYHPSTSMRVKQNLSGKRKAEENSLPLQNVRQMRRLEQHVKLLESRLESQASALSTHLTVCNSASRYNCEITPEPLLFVFDKVQKFLLGESPRHQSLQGRASSPYKQDVMCTSSDCTLSTFDAILSNIERRVPDTICITPSNSEIRLSIPSKINIVFPSLLSLLTLYEAIPESSAKKLFVSTRKVRGMSTSITRVIGCMRKASHTEELPCYISVGERLGTLSEVSTGERRVVYRPSCVWDEVEGYYKNELSGIKTTESELKSWLQNLVVDSEADGDSTICPEFGMTWERTDTGPQPIFQRESRTAILGILRITVPYVTVRGNEAVNDIIQAVDSLI